MHTSRSILSKIKVCNKDLRYEFEDRMNFLFNMCHCVAIQV